MKKVIKPSRPILRYHGGKWILANWILPHFPKHRIYVEPFGGAASLLLKKNRVYSEVYNDLDDEVVNLFQVVRYMGHELSQQLKNTPFSRKEFELSYQFTEDDLERARRTVVRSFMGFASAAVTNIRWGKNSKGFRSKGNYSGEYGKPSTGFRACSNRSGSTPAHDWKNFPEALEIIIARLKGVVIENKPAMDIMQQHDTENTLHYCDPPYVHDTRYKDSETSCYNFEMTDQEHIELAQFLKTLKGMVILSGYNCDLYEQLYSDWKMIKKVTFADSVKKRTECLWLNPATQKRQRQKDLFSTNN